MDVKGGKGADGRKIMVTHGRPIFYIRKSTLQQINNEERVQCECGHRCGHRYERSSGRSSGRRCGRSSGCSAGTGAVAGAGKRQVTGAYISTAGASERKYGRNGTRLDRHSQKMTEYATVVG